MLSLARFSRFDGDKLQLLLERVKDVMILKVIAPRRDENTRETGEGGKKERKPFTRLAGRKG